MNGHSQTYILIDPHHGLSIQFRVNSALNDSTTGLESAYYKVIGILLKTIHCHMCINLSVELNVDAWAILIAFYKRPKLYKTKTRFLTVCVK